MVYVWSMFEINRPNYVARIEVVGISGCLGTLLGCGFAFLVYRWGQKAIPYLFLFSPSLLFFIPIVVMILNKNRFNIEPLFVLIVFQCLFCMIFYRGMKAGFMRPLHKAVSFGNIEAVKKHLDAGADVNEMDPLNKVTPLHCAITNFNHKFGLGIVELLIANGGDVNSKDDGGRTPLHLATSEGYKEVAELLIIKGANADAENVDGDTPLDLVDGEVSIVEDKASAKRATTFIVVLVLVVSIIVIWNLFKY